MNAPERVVKRKLSFFQTMKAVFWSFFGVRKKSDYESDAAQLNPVHVVIAGIIAAALLVTTLVVIVRIVLSQAVGGV